MLEWSFDTRDADAARQTRIEFATYVNRRYGPNFDTAAAELVLGELIGNVVRYAPGVARVSASFDDRGVTISVRDGGHGFSRAHVRNENNLLNESGRGLAIVSRLAQTVEIDCVPDNGCCVSARLEVA